MPLFDRLGVSVADHVPLDRTDPRAPRDAYELVPPEGFTPSADALQSAFAAAWTGDTEVDGLSPLVLTAELGWREGDVIRAACRYLKQAGLQFSRGYIEDVVRGSPDFVQALLAYFHARFDPEHASPAAAAAAAVAELITASRGHPRTLSRQEQLVSTGVPRDLAARVAVLAGLRHALELVDASIDAAEPVVSVADHHDAVAERFDLPWLAGKLTAEPTDSYWTQAAKAALREEIVEHGVRLTRAAVAGVRPASTRVRAVVDQLRAQLVVELPMVLVAVHELRRAAAGSG